MRQDSPPRPVRAGKGSRLARGISAGVVALVTLAASPAGAQRGQTTPPARARASSILVEGESLVRGATASAGAVTAQAMADFGADWSHNAQLFWRAPDPVEAQPRLWPRISLSLDCAVAGEYLLTARHTQAPDYGDVRVFVGATAVGDFQGYAARVQVARTQLGKVQLVQGANAVTLAVFRRPPESSGSFVGLDAFELLPVPASGAAAAADGGGQGNVAPVGPTAVVSSVLPHGAKLVRYAHQNLDAPPSWTDAGDVDLYFQGKSQATATFQWDVSAVPNAKAIAYQVTRGVFGPYTFGEPMESKAYIATGARQGATGQLDIELPLVPPKSMAPANKTGVMAHYQVRVLPLRSVDDPQVVGAASNVFVVNTYAQQAPYKGPKIETSTIDPTVQMVKFTWVPYKYTEHWPPGCKPIPIGAPSQKGEIEVVGGLLSDAWNWTSKAYQDAKGFVVQTVVSVIAVIPPGIQIPPEVVATALDAALVAAGVPPSIPNLDQVMSDGAGFLAQQMVEQIPVPPEVTTGLVGDVAIQDAIDSYKNKVRQQAKSAILDGAQKVKSAAEQQSEYCIGRRDYEYLALTFRNVGPTVQKDVAIEVEDSVQAFHGLGFTIPVLAPGEEVVVPRYLYSPEHLNRPSVSKYQLESENQTESWHLWNDKYFKQPFTFKVWTVGQHCAGVCTPFQKYAYTTPPRWWGRDHEQGFSWQ